MSDVQEKAAGLVPELFYDLIVYWIPTSYLLLLASALAYADAGTLGGARAIVDFVNTLNWTLQLLVVFAAGVLLQVGGVYLTLIAHLEGTLLIVVKRKFVDKLKNATLSVRNDQNLINDTFLRATTSDREGIVRSKLLAKFRMMLNCFVANEVLTFYCIVLGSYTLGTVAAILTIMSFVDGIRRWSEILRLAKG